MKFFNQAEGYIEPDGVGGYDYVYQYKDHLGNVRLSYSDSNGDSVVDVAEIIEESNYYPFGLLQRGYNATVNGTENKHKTFQGQELEEELDKNVYAFQWRDYDPAIGRFNKIDRFAEKYKSLTPYHFTASNPIFFREIAGDSINVSDLQNNNPTALNTLDNDLEAKTGLDIKTNANGNLEYETEKGFLGIKRAKVKRDANGKKIGSGKARRRLKKAIKNKNTVIVKDNTGGGNYVPRLGANEINFDMAEINLLMNAASTDLDPTTVGSALVFLHELGHTGVGGSRDDPSSNADSKPGQNVKKINQIRRQLGTNYGIRATYGTTVINGNHYMPFSNKTKKQLKKGVVPTIQYLKF